jgi:hypothetical protein
MRIKMKTVSSGPAGCFQPGDERDVSDAEGSALVRGGYADDVTPRATLHVPRPIEVAVAPAREVSDPVIPQPQRGRRR